MTKSAAYDAALDRIRSLQERIGFNTHDGLTERDVARNLANRDAAFGWTNTNSNAPAGTFAAAVNHFASIEKAQDDLAAYFTRNGRDVTDAQWLDNLLPLNNAAVMMLMRAYQNVGTFRTPAELIRRTERREYSDAVRVAAE